MWHKSSARSLVALLCLAVLLVLAATPFAAAIPFAIVQPLYVRVACLLVLVAILAATNEINAPILLLTRVAAPRAPPVR